MMFATALTIALFGRETAEDRGREVLRGLTGTGAHERTTSAAVRRRGAAW